MKTNITATIIAAIIANIEARNTAKPEETKKETTEVKKDPRQEALDEFFSNPETFGCNHNDVRRLVETITGLTIEKKAVKNEKYSERYLIVVPTSQASSGHHFTIGKPVVTISRERHAFNNGPENRKDGIHKVEVRPATDVEIKTFIEDIKADTSKLEKWMNPFSVENIVG